MTTQAIFDQLGPRKYFVLVAIVMEIGMIAMLAVPIILTEEVEKHTIDALVARLLLVDIVAAKALGRAHLYRRRGRDAGLADPHRARAGCALRAGGLMLGVTLIGVRLADRRALPQRQSAEYLGRRRHAADPGAGLRGRTAGAGLVQTIFDAIPTSQATKVMIDSMTVSRSLAIRGCRSW